ncbi:MAG TPA: cyclic lactone autoinducer peptide [Lachnospiraceae bacterium]|nr:cyclic lactone autoinducer peptide [Lachnospiraceae bacterium]
MNRKKKMFYQLIANLAAMAIISTNLITCYFVFHQPEVPAEAKSFKLSKK